MTSSCCNNGSLNENDSKEAKDAASSTTTCSTSNEVERRAMKHVETSCCSNSTSEIAGTTIETASPQKEAESCCSKGLQKTVDSLNADTCCSSSSAVSTPVHPDRATYTYRIAGMDCPSCAATLEKGLSTIPEYRNVSVHYGAARLKIESETTPSDRRLRHEVKKLGFQLVAPDKSDQCVQTYAVSGMDCSSCAKTIEQHFGKMADVQTVMVSFARGEMEIAHHLDVRQVKSELNKIGFDGQVKGEESSTSSSRSYDGISLVLSGILIGLGLLFQTIGILYLPDALYGIALMLSGWKAFRSAFYAMRARSLDMNVLMSVAAIGATFIGEWLEGATVVFLFAIGNLLQNHSLARTRNSIQKLIELSPKEAFVLTEEGLIRKSVEAVQIGEKIRIRPGDQVALDGMVLKGTTTINQASITGESIPVDKSEGDHVFAGTLNMDRSFDMIVEKTYQETTLAHIIELVEEAQDNKAPSEAFIDRFAKIYTPFVFLGALLIMIVPPLLQLGSWGEWFYKGLELIVIACPCALVISTPVAIVTAIGNAARNGVLIKGGVFLEKAGKIDAVAFDKTGTLTKGTPAVQQFMLLSDDREHVLRIAHSLERHSSHPLAKAITEYAIQEEIHPLESDAITNRVGNGMSGEFEQILYHIGGVKWFREMGYELGMLDSTIANAEKQGQTVVLLGSDADVHGLFVLSDEVRDESADAVRKLKGKIKIKKLVMLTGDNAGAAARIGEKLNLDEVHANLLPHEKVHIVENMKKQSFQTAMVGDGINDAPAFVTADVSIAMGGAGTDTALETADIVLMADNLNKLPYTFDLSKATLTIIKQNVIFSILIKLIALMLVFPGWLTLWMAVLSDTGAAVLVTLNALRLLKKRTL
ncbi:MULTISPECIES: heavy metal translocating P-type ATPase [unclassified Exiguobacterium]|uniref:heavy metal translocating P-type ATPase n=1 Tax=unclassified Exiguobacterium TaxID=2644629 RepID=UPI0020367439|nr:MULTISPECIES: heavy metal translocating P-type ATPase [unclassified Exiguobacterium]